MPGIKTKTLAALLLLAPMLASAEDRIAVLDTQQAVLGTEFAREKIAEFQKRQDYQDAMGKLRGLESEIKQAIEDFKKNELVLTPEQKEERNKSVTQKQAQFQGLARDIQTAEQRFAQQLLAEQKDRLEEAVRKIIEDEGITLLLNRQAVLHAEGSYNITDKVRDALNK